MYFKIIETEGLAHYSYMIGDGDDIAVIDPMRDIDVYMHEARTAGMRIKYILETHRNEDFIIGSIELAEKTGATIYISGHEDLGHVYGERIQDGFELDIGEIVFCKHKFPKVAEFFPHAQGEEFCRNALA